MCTSKLFETFIFSKNDITATKIDKYFKCITDL